MKTVKADNRRRVQLPHAKPGQVFVLEQQGNCVTLTLVEEPAKVEPPTIRGKLVTKGGLTYFELPKGYTVPEDAISQAIKESWDEA
jgi:hypothetical protein